MSDPAGVFAGSRTSTPNLSASVGGAFGTFASAVPSGSATASADAWIYGLSRSPRRAIRGARCSSPARSRKRDFVVYGVVNDGPSAGSRTSDGSYIPMVVTN